MVQLLESKPRLVQDRQTVLHPLWNSIKPPGEGQQTVLCSEHALQQEEENRKKKSLPFRKRQKSSWTQTVEGLLPGVGQWGGEGAVQNH